MSHDIVPDSSGTPLFIILVCIFVVGTFIVAFSLEPIVLELSRAARSVKRVFSVSWWRGQDGEAKEHYIPPKSTKGEASAPPQLDKNWSWSGLRRRLGKTGHSDRTEDEAEKAVGLENGHAR